MKTRGIVFLFLVAAAIQLAVPAAMIAKRERILRQGEAFKFRTEPVDPYDAFRGRYVALRFEQNSVELPLGHDFATGGKAYAVLATDAEGFAYFSGLRRSRPGQEPFLRTQILSVSGTNAFLRLPFDRFYMEEGEAPEAERAYRQHSAPEERNAYVQIKIRNGYGVIEDLYIDATPIREFLARQ